MLCLDMADMENVMSQTERDQLVAVQVD